MRLRAALEQAEGGATDKMGAFSGASGLTSEDAAARAPVVR